MNNDRSQYGLMECLDAARAKGPREFLAELERIDAEIDEAKWAESGRNHSRWARNWAVRRMRHIINQDERFPRPTENHVFSMIEQVRPVFTDNVPDIQITALRPDAGGEWILNRVWDWVAARVDWDAFWASLYDYFPETGVTGGKALWDFTAPDGGCPRIEHMDPRSIGMDPRARINHRSASIVRTKHLVDVGELRSLFPEMADKINPVSQHWKNPRDLRLETGRDIRGYNVSGYKTEDHCAEVVEMWIRPQPMVSPFSETELNSAPMTPSVGSEEPWLVITYITGAGVVSEEIAQHGCQIATGQCWRNPDSWVGISDVEMIIGLQIAHDQLAIRGHAHRLATFAPPLILPRDVGIEEKDVAGRAAPIWKPSRAETFGKFGWMNVPAPNQEALAYYAENPQKMRRILGIDEITTDLFERYQTATAVSAVREAVEARTRQKIRNLHPMAADLARSLVCMTVAYYPLSMFVRTKDGSFDEITREQMDTLNMADYTVRVGNAKSGPLTDYGKMASIRQAYELGLFTDETGMPNPPVEVKEQIVDLLSLPKGDEVKRAIREQDMMRKQMMMIAAMAPPAGEAPAEETAAPAPQEPAAPPPDPTALFARYGV